MAPIALIIIDSPTTNTKAKDNPCCSEIKPMIGGPIKNPVKLIVDTTAMADSAVYPGSLAAEEYKMGIIHENPKPTRENPTMAAHGSCKIKRADILRADKRPPPMTSFFLPNFGISISPVNLPTAMNMA